MGASTALKIKVEISSIKYQLEQIRKRISRGESESIFQYSIRDLKNRKKSLELYLLTLENTAENSL